MSEPNYKTSDKNLEKFYWNSFIFITDDLHQAGYRGMIFWVHYIIQVAPQEAITWIEIWGIWWLIHALARFDVVIQCNDVVIRIFFKENDMRDRFILVRQQRDPIRAPYADSIDRGKIISSYEITVKIRAPTNQTRKKPSQVFPQSFLCSDESQASTSVKHGPWLIVEVPTGPLARVSPPHLPAGGCAEWVSCRLWMSCLSSTIQQAFCRPSSEIICERFPGSFITDDLHQVG